MSTPRIAANPIPYWSRAGKTRAAFDEAFRDYQEIGITAVKADVPETVDMAGELERAKRFAAGQPVSGRYDAPVRTASSGPWLSIHRRGAVDCRTTSRTGRTSGVPTGRAPCATAMQFCTPVNPIR